MERTSRGLHRNTATNADLTKLKLKASFNCEEAALYLGLCPKTIRRHTQAGTIPSWKLGRFTMYSKIALDEMMVKRTIGGGLK
ncbi:helix-turn-helix domain-containing protein [Verrucomicrobia bacterium]|jgi:excisionase family DNA binding protein|nr:helix-turn-helix domain-containing protein [Verrucomicrobiota bacterium]